MNGRHCSLLMKVQNDLFVISIPFVYSKYTTRECTNTNIHRSANTHTYAECIHVKWKCTGPIPILLLLLFVVAVVCQNISFHISTVISKVSKSSISSGDGSAR